MCDVVVIANVCKEVYSYDQRATKRSSMTASHPTWFQSSKSSWALFSVHARRCFESRALLGYPPRKDERDGRDPVLALGCE